MCCYPAFWGAYRNTISQTTVGSSLVEDVWFESPLSNLLQGLLPWDRGCVVVSEQGPVCLETKQHCLGLRSALLLVICEFLALLQEKWNERCFPSIDKLFARTNPSSSFLQPVRELKMDEM